MAPAATKKITPRKSTASQEDDLLYEPVDLAADVKAPVRRDQSVPKPWICQLAVASTQAAFVMGSVYLKGSLQLVDEAGGERFHPIVYAFGREAMAGPMLFLVAWLTTGVALPARQDALRFVSLGSCMFFAQLFYIIGIELSGVAVASCMQPAIPVFTVLLGISLQMESANPQKLAGIGLAVLGAVSMVMGGLTHAPPATAAVAVGVMPSALSAMATGNCCLLVNTFAMALYYILAKKAVAKYPAAVVAAWAYIVAASMMGGAALVFTERADWAYPRALILPLIYWVLVCSVVGYLVVTWAMRHLPASQVASFQCLQPFLGSLLAFVVLHEQPSWWDLGAVGVLAGLLLVSLDRRDVQEGGAAWVARLKKMAGSKSVGGFMDLARSVSGVGLTPPKDKAHALA